MAARYFSTFYSAYAQKQHTVFVYDSEFTGDISEITLQNVELNYPPGQAGRFDTVLAAELSAKIIINTSELDTFVEDLAGAPEGRFMLSLTQGITNLFIGYVLPDLAQQEDTTIEVGYVFDLRATDGLARLKTIPYNNSGNPYEGAQTFIEHIFNCLNKLPDVLGFYASNNFLLRTVVNWHAQQYTYASSINPLARARVPHRAFYTIDTKGNYVYRTCFEVLEEICRAWGARMVYSEYAFYFVQINEYATPSAKTVFSYTKTQTQTSQTVDFRRTHNQADTGSDLVRLGGGIFRFFPPLKNVQVDYKHIATRNFVAGWRFNDAALIDQVSSFGQSARFSFSGTIRAAVVDVFDPPPGEFPIYLIVNISIKVNTQYLVRTAQVVGGSIVYGAPEWTSTPLPTNARYQVAILLSQSDREETIFEQFITPSLLDEGELTFEIVSFGLYKLDGTASDILSIGTLFVSTENLYLELLFEGTLDNQADIRRFIATNNAPGNSATIEFPTIIGDGIGMNSPGHIEVLNDDTEWEISEGWRVGNSGTFREFSTLLAAEIIRGQLTPVRRYFGRYAIRETGRLMYAHHVISRADGVMVFAGGRYIPGFDEYDGEWFFITPQSSGWTDEPFLDIPADQSPVANRPPGGSSGSSGGGTPTAPVRIFQQEFSPAENDDTITITANGGVLPTNPAGIIVWLRGAYVEPEYWTVNGSDIEFTFTFGDGDTVAVMFFIQ
jgi:hypothetical protein